MTLASSANLEANAPNAQIAAPMSYVVEYYANDWRLRDTFPTVTSFIDGFYGKVDGDAVLNAGCGPQFYDVHGRLARAPQTYVGVDFGEQTIRFLAEGSDPRFLAGRQSAEATSTRFEIHCGDIMTAPQLTSERFDAVIAVGFVGTFHGAALDALLARLWSTLKPGGQFVKMTWHGPHRTPEQTAKKLEFGYDSLEEHEPDAFRLQIENAGFRTLEHELLRCDPETYRWDVVQACMFEKV